MSAPASGHRPGRKGHCVLSYLADRPNGDDPRIIASAIGLLPASHEARKFQRYLRAMVGDDFLASGRRGGFSGAFWITPAGLEALARLDRGEIVSRGAALRREKPGAPRVRVFRSDAA